MVCPRWATTAAQSAISDRVPDSARKPLGRNRCPSGDACEEAAKAGDDTPCGCLGDGFGLGSVGCAPSYTGILCAVCEKCAEIRSFVQSAPRYARNSSYTGILCAVCEKCVETECRRREGRMGWQLTGPRACMCTVGMSILFVSVRQCIFAPAASELPDSANSLAGEYPCNRCLPLPLAPRPPP